MGHHVGGKVGRGAERRRSRRAIAVGEHHRCVCNPLGLDPGQSDRLRPGKAIPAVRGGGHAPRLLPLVHLESLHLCHTGRAGRGRKRCRGR